MIRPLIFETLRAHLKAHDLTDKALSLGVTSHSADGDKGYTVRLVTTDQAGNITSEYNGYQATLDSEVNPTLLDWKTSTETGQADGRDDGSYQTTVSSTGEGGEMPRPLRMTMKLQSCNESNYQCAA